MSSEARDRRTQYHRARMESGPDSMDVRRALLAKVDAGEMAFEDVQKEVRRLSRLPWSPPQ